MSDANVVGAENRRRIVLHFRDQFLDLVRASREQVDQYALNELKNIVKFSKQRIPWYTNSFESIGDVDSSESLQALLQSLPILSRLETFDTNFTYEVIETAIVDETDIKTVYENPSLKSDTDGESWLTITTCVTDGPTDKRIAIFAKLVSSAAKN